MLYPTGKTLPLLLTSIFLFISSLVNAQSNGRLSGKVVDRSTQRPLAGMTVLLQDSAKELQQILPEVLGLLTWIAKRITLYFQVLVISSKRIITSLSVQVMKPPSLLKWNQILTHFQKW